MADSSTTAPESNLPVTLEEAKAYCGADIPNDANDRILTGLIKTADRYLEGSIGKDYPRDDERAKQLALSVIDEWYNAGAKAQKVSAAIERMVVAFSDQLRCDLKKKGV